ncbi:MAG: hypothetical protein M1438_09455 [Deltaproteobacteria bacterium]|nr:hypothetical protein [Deltaproteobacteria bacterium]
MEPLEKRYEKQGKARPCFLDQDDLVNLARIVQETFTRPEIDRYFRISTTLNGSRVFCSTMADFLVQEDLPDRVHDLTFWIEGWGQKTRFDKTILLDFSGYSVQLKVEGVDPVWVFDKYNRIMKFLREKSAWYWPVIIFEKPIVFCITILLISSMILNFRLGKPVIYLGELGMLAIWAVSVFYDTRKIWPYSLLRLKGSEPLLNTETFSIAALLIILVSVLMGGAAFPFFR